MSFYTYAHIRKSDGKLFYIGKGHGRRAWASAGRSSYWNRVATKHGHEVEILAKWSSEEEAFAHERFLIAAFKGLGHELVNLTDGGEGFSGGKHTEQWRAEMSMRFKGRYSPSPSAETRAKLSAATKANPSKHWLGKKHRPESIAKRTAARLYQGRQYTEGGVTLSVRGWAERLGMHHSSITYRIEVGKPLLSPKFSRK